MESYRDPHPTHSHAEFNSVNQIDTKFFASSSNCFRKHAIEKVIETEHHTGATEP